MVHLGCLHDLVFVIVGNLPVTTCESLVGCGNANNISITCLSVGLICALISSFLKVL